MFSTQKFPKKYVDSSASSYCILVMFWVTVLTCFFCGLGAVAVHVYFDDRYNGWFVFYMVGVLLFNQQIVGTYFLIRGLVRPFQKINEAATKLASGDFNIQTTYEGNVNEIQSVFDDFNVMAQELSGINTLRSDFVSNVSHEFKTPLASLEGYALYLQDPDISEAERQDCLDHIISNVRKLSNLTGDILMLSKLEHNNLNFQKNHYRLDEQIRQVVLLHERAWEAKNLKFDMHLEEITYYGVEHLLEHVWSNLIGNAVKYSHENGEIRMALSRNQDGIIVQIEDFGIGISETAFKHIFEKFYQEDTQHKHEGNGLGLAQVQEILKLTGNLITVKSELGKGSIFTVRLFPEAS